MQALCDVCGLKPATNKCPQCGRAVCEDDFDEAAGVCLVCLEARCAICGRGLSVGHCSVCGRQGCEACLVEVSPVQYVCKECASALGISFRERLKFKL